MLKYIFLLIFISIFPILNCTEKLDESSTVPPTPTMFGPPADVVEVERGIDAIPDFDGIQLDWHVENTSEISEYNIYRRVDGESQFLKLHIADAKDTTYLDLNSVQVGTRYYYYMTAVSYDGVEGAASDTVNYMLLSKAFHLFNSVTSKPIFRWEVSEYPAQYVLKLFDTATAGKIWFALVQSDYTNQDEQVQFNFDGTAGVDSLTAGRSYTWRVDIVGTVSNSGSESRWKQFTVEN